MTIHRIAVSFALGLGLLGATSAVAWALDSDPADPPPAEDKGHEKEQATTLDKVPAPVRKALKEQAKGGTVQKVAQVMKGNNIAFYEAKLKMPDGTTTNIEVAPDGSVMSVK